jgi:hypothetical protein
MESRRSRTSSAGSRSAAQVFRGGLHRIRPPVHLISSLEVPMSEPLSLRDELIVSGYMIAMTVLVMLVLALVTPA